jgi:hypothetical protein
MGQGLFHWRCFCADGVFDALSRDTQRAKAQSFCGAPTVADAGEAPMNGYSPYFVSILRRTLMSAGAKEGVRTIQ